VDAAERADGEIAFEPAAALMTEHGEIIGMACGGASGKRGRDLAFIGAEGGA
jgi:hypothetical protein